MLAKAMLAFSTVVRSFRIRGWGEAFTGAGLSSLTKVLAVYFMAIRHSSVWNKVKMVQENKSVWLIDFLFRISIGY